MGGSSGGGGRTPVEAKNTAKSAQRYKAIHAIAEGVLAGFGNGDDAPLKSVYLNDTPVQNASGTFNFKGVEIYAQAGTQEQSYVPGFDTTERTVGVSTEVKNGTPVVRTVSDAAVDTLRVTVGINMNMRTADNGDTSPSNTTMLIELLNANGVQTARTVAFTEKSGGMYYEDVVFDTLPAAPFSIRASRVTADSDSNRRVDNTYFSSYVEVVTAKLSYPHTALLFIKMDSEQFGSQMPKLNVLVKAAYIKVPSNYNPETRAYVGFWDGSFKEAWSDNPAWVFYDLLTQPRYSGLAKRLNAGDIDKAALYSIARYCDELVPDGRGGQEPRFTCNIYKTEEDSAGEVLADLASCFRGMAFWNGTGVTAALDGNSDPVALYTNSNVVDGKFTYSGVAWKSIHTAVQVQFVDPDNGYRTTTEYIADDAAIKRYGLNVKQVTAFGCQSRGQAVRLGRWLLETELLQQEAVSFAVGREGLRHQPYDVIQVMNNDRAGVDAAGRVVAVAGAVVTLDRDLSPEAGKVAGAVFRYGNTAGGISEAVVTAQPANNQLRLQAAPADMAAGAQWLFAAAVKPQQYRCVSITENTDEGTYTINALLHSAEKEAVVDNGAVFERQVNTLHTLVPVLSNISLEAGGGGVGLKWDLQATAGDAVAYNVDVYKDGQLYRQFFRLPTAEIRLENLPNGDYRAEIRGRNARGVLSEPLVKAWSINYTITGLRTEAKLFAIGLTWTLPEPVVRAVHTEIWYGTKNDINKAAKLAALPYPQNEYTLTGVKISDRYYFWVRIVDDGGISGEYTASVAGVCDTDPAPIIAQITGAITESTLSRELIDQLDGKIAAGNSAMASRVSTVETQTGQNTASITSTSNAVTSLTGKVSAMHTVKVETISGGRRVVAGTALGVDGATGDSQFLVYADKFGLVNPNSKQIDSPFAVTTKAGGSAQMALKGDFIATDSILARHIAASQTITTPILSAPTINAGQLNSTAINNGNGNFTVDAAGNLYAKSGRFEGEVRADKISGDVTKWYEFRQTTADVLPVGGKYQRVRRIFQVSLTNASGLTASGYVPPIAYMAAGRPPVTWVTINGILQNAVNIADGSRSTYEREQCTGLFNNDDKFLTLPLLTIPPGEVDVSIEVQWVALQSKGLSGATTQPNPLLFVNFI